MDKFLMIENSSIIKLLTTLGVEGTLQGFHPLTGGISASMTQVSILKSSGETLEWIIRQASAETLQNRPLVLTMEYGLLKVLQKHHLPVPSPVFIDDQAKIFNTPTLVLEYLPGELDFSADAQPARASELARITAGIHRINLQEIKDIDFPILGDTINSLCGEPPYEMDEVINERGIREFLQAHWPPKHPNRAVLLHGDIWNGNILWKDNRINGVIDWEDAWIGEPLLDIAGVRLDLACEFGVDLAEQFTCEYLSLHPLDIRDLPLWDLVASLWFTRFLNEDFIRFPDFFAKYGRPDITIESMRRVVKHFAQQAIERYEEND